MKKATLLSESLLVGVTIIWGLGFPITKLAVMNGFGPNTVLFARFFVAAFLMALIYRKRLKMLSKRYWLAGGLTGVFLFMGFYFQTLGAIYTTPSKNAFITQLNIIFVPFLYTLYSKIKADRYNVIAVLVAIFGLYLISFRGTRLDEVNIGDVFTFICAILVAFHIVLSSHFQKKYDFDPPVFVWVSMVIALFFAFIFTPFETIPPLHFAIVWPLIFLGVFNTALGFSVQSYALKISHPTRVSLIVSLEGMFGAIGSYLIIKEVLTWEIVAGGMLILLGILITELNPTRRKLFKEASTQEKSVPEETLRMPF